MFDFTLYTYNQILQRMLGRIPDTVDKRQGSIIYDALAPAAAELAQAYINLDIWKSQTYLLTATGNNLDNRGADFAIARNPATNAYRIAVTIDTDGNPINLPLNSRFAAPNVEGGITFYILEYTNPGECILVCEQLGSAGNDYYGAILPLFVINNLAEATIIGTLQPGVNVESDEDYRERILDRLKKKPFGGNIADYQRFVKEIIGVGDAKVFPVWNGGGTVLISVVDYEYKPITLDFIQLIKNTVDPLVDTGLGIGTAPIGHVVTVRTPQIAPINVEATILLDNKTVGQVQMAVEENLEEYFYSLRKLWADAPNITVFVARIIETIVRTPGVLNVMNVKINGETSDIVLTDTYDIQLVPFLGVLTLNEQ